MKCRHAGISATWKPIFFRFKNLSFYQPWPKDESSHRAVARSAWWDVFMPTYILSGSLHAQQNHSEDKVGLQQRRLLSDESDCMQSEDSTRIHVRLQGETDAVHLSGSRQDPWTQNRKVPHTTHGGQVVHRSAELPWREIVLWSTTDPHRHRTGHQHGLERTSAEQSIQIQHLNLNEIGLYLDRGQEQHAVKPIQPNYGDGTVRAYNSLFARTGKLYLYLYEGLFVSHEDYDKGYAPYVFDLTADLGKDFSLMRQGSREARIWHSSFQHRYRHRDRLCRIWKRHRRGSWKECHLCRSTLCLRAVFAVALCLSICLTICHVAALYPDGWRYHPKRFFSTQ